MGRYIVEELREYDEAQRHHAASKARLDARDSLLRAGYEQIPFAFADNRFVGPVKKLLLHQKVARKWKQALAGLGAGDVVVFQYPLFHQTLFFDKVLHGLSRRGVVTVLLMHDVQSIRDANTPGNTGAGSARVHVQEKSALRAATYVIAHNERMCALLRDDFGIPRERLIPLGIFDYLRADGRELRAPSQAGPVVVAGNLSSEKAGYVYDLPTNVAFRLYGLGYEPEHGVPQNVEHMGAFPPDELPSVLEGSYGLVWDGPTASTCRGVYGEYLRVNNPHKTSLYLAAGLPVVLWDQAALAPFVREHGVGLAVSSLDDLRHALDAVSSEQYQAMCANARKVSRLLGEGHYLLAALEQVE